MKFISLLLLAFSVTVTAGAQHTVAIRNLWAAPQVHVAFRGYTISFTVKDVDKALLLLAATGDSLYGTSSGLDTAKTYTIELYPGTQHQYKSPLQPMLQSGIGCFLLLAGHATIENPKHKKLKEIVADMQPGPADDAFVQFYDPQANTLIFSGSMAKDLYNQDLGID